MKDALQFIIELHSRGIAVQEQDDQLKVSGHVSSLTPADKELIRALKADILEFLRANREHTGGFKRIGRAPLAEAYPLSSGQKRLWVLSQLRDTNVAYNFSGVYHLEGNLDADAFQAAFMKIFERHEILRTAFRAGSDGNVYQHVLPITEVGFRVTLHDGHAESGHALANTIQQEIAKPFDLSRAPLLRASLYQTAANHHVFCYVMHHIISDAWSMDILRKELFAHYNSITSGASVQMKPLEIQYKDYACWQQENLGSSSFMEDRAFWLNMFDGEIPVANLPLDKPRPAVKTYSGASVHAEIPVAVVTGLRQLCLKNDCSLFMGLLAAFKALLFRYTNQTDIVVGTSIANRDHIDIQDQIGFYVNTLAFRTTFSNDDTFTALLQKVRKVTVESYQHQNFPFDELVNLLPLQRDVSRSVLFDTMLVLQTEDGQRDAEHVKLGDLKISAFEGTRQEVSKFDLTLFCTDTPAGLHLSIAYNTDIFEERTVRQLAKHFTSLINAVIDDPSVPVEEIEYFAEERTALEKLGRASVDYPKDKSFIDLFKQAAAANGENVAIAFRDQNVTYGKADEQSRNIAGYLTSQCNVSRGDVVAVVLDRSAEMIIAMLGIMKAGAAYVVIEPDLPAKRKEFILQNTSAKVIITQSSYIFDFPNFAGSLFAVDLQLDSIDASPDDQTECKATDTAYIVYTSGSTGQPKGVPVTHEAILDYSFGVIDQTNMRECETFGLVSTASADLGNTVIFPALMLGKTLRVFSSTDVMSPQEMSSAQIDCLKIVPSHWAALQQGHHTFVPRKCLIFGGETLTRDVVTKVRQVSGSCQVYNHYGPSETTVGKLMRRIEMEADSPVLSLGRPFGNCEVIIADSKGQHVPMGVTGEVLIAGVGVTGGYLNDPMLTEQKFCRYGDSVFYRTGDLGRWLPDGTVQFIGRKDEQVKIRGYRIEVGEITSCLKSVPGVSSALVIPSRDTQREVRLIAYLVSSEKIDASSLRTYLSESLPPYMIPSHFVQIDAVPLTSNGKVDKRRLPNPEEQKREFIGPRNHVEDVLMQIWKEVLGDQPISVTDNFFDLGGNSLKIVKMVWLIENKLGQKVTVVDAFKYHNISMLAEFVSNGAPSANTGPVNLHEDQSIDVMDQTLKLLAVNEQSE